MTGQTSCSACPLGYVGSSIALGDVVTVQTSASVMSCADVGKMDATREQCLDAGATYIDPDGSLPLQ